jgi:hypothetical protein
VSKFTRFQTRGMFWNRSNFSSAWMYGEWRIALSPAKGLCCPMTDADLWQLTSEARLRAQAAERQASEAPSRDTRETWHKAEAEYARLAREWRHRTG